MSDDSHLPTPLAHGRWAGDRVGRSAREAGASLKTLSKRATLTEQQRHRLGSGSFEWRQPEKQRSQRGGLFWTVFPRGAVQNGAQLDRIAARESEDLLFNAHTSPAMCVELTGGPPVRWFVILLLLPFGSACTLVFMRRPFSGLALFRAVEALHAATALLEPLHGCAAAHAGLAVGGGGGAGIGGGGGGSRT